MVAEGTSGGGTATGSGQRGHFAGVAKHSLIYGIGMLLGRAISFIMLPIYTRYLTPADYGVMGLIELTLDFVAIIAGAQLAAGVFRFYHKAENADERSRVVSTSFLIVAGMYFVVGSLAFLSAPLLSQLIFGTTENALLFRIAATNLAMSSLAIVPLALARVEDRSVFFVGANMAKLTLMVALNIVFLVVLGWGILGVFLSSLISNALIGVVLAFWILRRVSFTFDRVAARSLVRYGLPLVGMQVATFVATFGDRFFLQGFADEAVVGLYNLAYQFGFLLVMVGFVPVDQIWGPKRFQIAKEPGGEAVLAKGFLLINLVLVTVGVGIALFVDDVLKIMTAPAFHEASRVVPVILVAYVFQAWASIQDIGILVRERTEYLTLANAVSAAVALAGYALLIPPFLAWGAAFATVLAFATRYFLTYWFSQRLWTIQYPWWRVLGLVAWGGAIFGVGVVIRQEVIWVSLLVNSGLLLTFLVGALSLPILDQDERGKVLGAFRQWVPYRMR